jgi:hypothetical protein
MHTGEPIIHRERTEIQKFKKSINKQKISCHSPCIQGL